MLDPADNFELPPIPGKRYFTIGEVSELCAVKPHVLRYWEQEFPRLNPVKRRGNRRYFRRQDVVLVRQIRNLLYVEGFTISGARNKLAMDEPANNTGGRSDVVKTLIENLEDVLTLLDQR
ncbi:MAG: MerR family transcriptional regulator [Gammaproteobacteria bacterium]|jgi:DNA-binding transcriptional MerR regulator|nr:MerR family transcriptional regulator [Gammaproteobacteria bacterium]